MKLPEVGTHELGSAAAGSLPELLAQVQSRLFAVLQEAGYEHPTLTGRSDALQLTAQYQGRPVLLVFAPVAEQAMALQALRESDCRSALRLYPAHDVAYAALVYSRAESVLDMVGPLPVRQRGVWLTDEPQTAQFLPLSYGQAQPRCRAVLGGAALYKETHVLLPFLHRAGQEARFSVAQLFDETATPAATALRAFGTPTLLLMPGEQLLWYDDGAPLSVARLEENRSGRVRLTDEAERELFAECAEARLYPEQLLAGGSYRWALSLPAESAECQPQVMPVQPEGLLQAEPAQVGQLALLAQPQRDAETLLGGCVRSVAAASVCTCPMQRVVLAIPGAEVAVYIGAEMPIPAAGDWLLVRGRLCAAPTERLEQGWDERAAVRLFARTLASRDWEGLRPRLAEGVRFRSAQLSEEVQGREAFLEHLSRHAEEWERMTGLAGVSYELGVLPYHGQKRPCCMIEYAGRRDCGLVLRVHDQRITEAETVPLSCHAAFEPVPAEPLPGVFAPYASPMVPHPAVLTPLQRFALQALDRKLRAAFGMSETYGDGKARWIQVLRDEPSFCDMAFQYGPHVFAVRVVRVERMPQRAEEVRALADAQLLAAAERYDVLPCVFPVQPGVELPLDTGWNLCDMRSGEPVNPEDMPEPPQKPSFVWDRFLEAEQVVAQQIAEQGGHVLTSHNTPDVLPHLWYRDAAGELRWCVVRTQETPAPADTPLSAAEERLVELLGEGSGVLADVGFTALDGKSPAQRGARHLYFTHPLIPAQRPSAEG